MKHALISPNEHVSYISSWHFEGKTYLPVITTVPNAQRVAEIAVATFEVAPPLFWVDCTEEVVADRFYYASDTAQIFPVPPDAPMPEPEQPAVGGAQTL